MLLEPGRVSDAEDVESQEALAAVASFYGTQKEVGLVESNMQEGYDETVRKFVGS